jgi:hypothetical protein
MQHLYQGSQLLIKLIESHDILGPANHNVLGTCPSKLMKRYFGHVSSQLGDHGPLSELVNLHFVTLHDERNVKTSWVELHGIRGCIDFLLASDISPLKVEDIVKTLLGEDDYILIGRVKFVVTDGAVHSIKLFDTTRCLVLSNFDFNKL